MTRIKLTADNNYFRLKINGHAGYADPGSDIVCSAISVLTYTVAQLVEDSADKLYGRSVKISDGQADISFTAKEMSTDEIRQKLCAICRGFELLQASYPDYVFYKKVGRDDKTA